MRRGHDLKLWDLLNMKVQAYTWSARLGMLDTWHESIVEDPSGLGISIGVSGIEDYFDLILYYWTNG